ncbi:MAG: T9SS type A sorting domain-containing protein [Bacteroidia bacterium]
MKKIILSFLLYFPFVLLAQGSLNLASLPLQIAFNQGNTPTYTFSGNISNIVSRNPGILSWTINGNSVTFNALKAGRTGLKITSGSQVYYIGVRVNHTNGAIPGLPQYLSIGSVSEDLTGDLAFWKDIDTDATNKAMDIRYIYINGGAIGGWQSWGPDRPAKFARESIRHGLIPFFVYYNIPDNGESYLLDLAHAQDVTYMTAYYQDLNNFMDSVQTVMNGDLYGIILEPDFLGYMQQNAVPNNPYLIPTAVGETTIANNAGNIATLVHRINKTIATKRNAGHKIFYGWQLNLWAYGNHAGSKGILRKSDNLNLDAAKYLIGLTAKEMTAYGMNAGILSHGADFISIDKYGLDAMGQNNTPNPSDCTWFFNNDHWNNYLLYVNQMYKISGKPVILWQLPVGRINESLYGSAYTGQPYEDMDNTPTKYEDSSTDFFLGDGFLPMSIDRINYFTENKYNDPKMYYAPGSGIVHWGNHLQETKNAGVISALFGAGVNASTDGVGNPPSDNYFWIQKVQDYYANAPIPLNQVYGENPANPCPVTGCSPTIHFINPTNGGKIVRSELDSAFLRFWVDDIDGKITTLVVKIDGQTQPSTLQGLQTIAWTPPTSWGMHTLTVTATDNDNHTTTENITFELVNFDATACGHPEWNSTQIYNVPNNIVSYNGLIFKNKWYTVNEMPYLGGTSSPWELEGVCDVLLDTTVVAIPAQTAFIQQFYTYPNPASQSFKTLISLQKPALAQLVLWDKLGRKVDAKSIYVDNQQAVISWEKPLVPGIYFLQLQVGKELQVEKVAVE